MATDVTNCVEDVEMSECEEDKVVTMMDVLQEQEDFEEDANAVLGASDDKNCTYSKGYIKRQALYACMTCCSEAKSDPTKRAGLCLACSLICHENHELVELYTKRNFRCDCGNSKFNSYRCQLTPNKVTHNEENSYNQNFSGLYCVCQRPYPDPNNKVEDDMIQCIICEDWLHASHLETIVPANDQYTEMICKGCMNKNDFLYSYSNLVVNVDSTEVDIININETEKSICNGDTKTGNNINSQENQDVPEEIPVTSNNMCKIEIDQNIKSTNNSSEMINNLDSQDNQHSILCENETPSKLPEILTDSPMSSNNIENVVNEMPEKMLNPNTEINKIEDIADTKKDENVSVNSSEQNKSDDQPEEILNDNNVSGSTEIVDNKAKSQEEDTNQDSNVTNKETQDDNITTEATVKNKNKDEESMEEDRLLGDSENEDKNSKSNLNDEKREESKTSYSIDNASSDKQIDEIESGNKTLNSPTNDENESGNSKQEIENKTIILPNDKEESTKLINEESQEPDPCLVKTSNLGEEVKDVENNELPLIDKPNNKQTESNIENHIDNIKATTSEKEVQEESGNTEQSTSNLCKDSEPNTLDKVTEKRKLSTEESLKNIAAKKTKLEEGNGTKSCMCPRNVKKVHKGATFWPSNFRQKLCTCEECLTLYKDLSVLFLIDPEDTVSTYTNLGIEKTNGKPSQYEKGLQALSSLDRIQQINALTEYNKMRDKLLDFLKSFKDRKEIVKEEDIKAFFAGMKPTRAPDGVYFCR